MKRPRWTGKAIVQRTLTLWILAIGVTQAVPTRVLAAAPGVPGAAEVVAVLQFEQVGASPAEASAATDRLQEKLLESGRFVIVDRGQTESVLSEQALQQTVCAETECAVKVGKILGAQKLVVGKITRLDATHWMVAAKLVDVETARALRSPSVLYEGTFFDFLRWGMAELASRLAEPNGSSMASASQPAEPGGGRAALDSPPPEGDGRTAVSAVQPAEPDVPPKSGWAVATGTTYRDGTLKTESGRKLHYSVARGLQAGVGYQKATPHLGLNVFLAETGGNVQGDMQQYYNTARGVVLGVQVRYLWLGGAYLGGEVGWFNTTFQNSDTGLDSLAMSGGGAGVVGGYEWQNGLFIDLALTQATLKAVDTEGKGKLSNAAFLYGTATENQAWLNLGYRWK